MSALFEPIRLWIDQAFVNPPPHGFFNFNFLPKYGSLFIQGIECTLLLAVVTGPLGYFASFLMAWIITLVKKGRGFFSLAFYAPSLTSGVAMSTIWLILFSGDRWTRATVLCGGVMLVCLHLNYGNSSIYGNCEIALTRTVIFILGCALGKSVKDDEPIAPHLPLLGLLWILLNNSLRRNTGLDAVWIRFSYIPLCISAVLVCLWVLEKLERLTALRKALRFFGERSLELYLTHVLIRNVFYHYIPVKAWDSWGILTYAVILLISLIVSTALHPVINKLCGALLARKETV